MNGFDEKKYGNLLETVSTTSNQAQLQNALLRVKREKQRKKRISQTMITAAIICLALIGTIRFSSTFAYAVAQLPGMKPLVEMIASDKGMEDIIANEYYEEMNVSQTIDGNTLTITGVVADESGMILYYKFNSATDLHNFQDSPKVELFQNKQPLNEVSVGASWLGQQEGTFEVENSVEVIASDTMDYGNRQFELQFSLPNLPEIVFELPFTLQNDITPSKHIQVNKQITMDNQTITVHELVLSPIRSQLKLSIDPDNTMEILHFADVRLYDEKGEQWGKIKNGVAGKGSIEDDQFSIMLESNYFRTPKSFELVFEQIEAIPKKDAFVTIDWDKKKVIKQPSHLNLELQINDAYEITYTLPNYEKNEHKGVFDKMIDAKGNEYLSNSTWISSNEDEQQIGQFYDVDTPPVNPVQLKVTRYESYLKEKGKIEVKVK